MNRRGFLGFLVTAPLTKFLPWHDIAKFIEPFAPETAATISFTVSEIVEMTIRARVPGLIANIEANNALLKRLKRG